MDAQQKWKAVLGRDVSRPLYIRQAGDGAPIVIPFHELSKQQASLLQAALKEALGDRLAHFAVAGGRAYVHLSPYAVQLDRALGIVQTLVQPTRLGVLVTLYSDARNSREVRWEIRLVTVQFPNPQWVDEVTHWHSTLKFDGLELHYRGHDKVVGSVVHPAHALTRADRIVELFCDRFMFYPVRTVQVTAPM